MVSKRWSAIGRGGNALFPLWGRANTHPPSPGPRRPPPKEGVMAPLPEFLIKNPPPPGDENLLKVDLTSVG